MSLVIHLLRIQEVIRDLTWIFCIQCVWPLSGRMCDDSFSKRNQCLMCAFSSLLMHYNFSRLLSYSSTLSVTLGGYLLLKCSTINRGFNGAETSFGIALILVLLLMSSYDIQVFQATTICCLSPLNWLL